MIFWPILIWIICGILSYGFVLPGLHGEYDPSYERSVNRAMAFFVGCFGPISLFLIVLFTPKTLRFQLW